MAHDKTTYRQYLLRQGLTDNTANAYASGLAHISRHFGADLFAVTDPTRLDSLMLEYGIGGQFSSIGNYGHGTARNALKHWVKLNRRPSMDSEGEGSTMPEYSITEEPALNLILFGPPGTGKTFETVDAALAIVAPTFLSEHPEIAGTHSASHTTRRAALKRRFDALSEDGRIRFVTFHQSFSYEDFVEGLRAQSGADNQIEYKVEDGVFKKLCDDARTYATRKQSPELAGNPQIWKISIDGTGSSRTRQYCLEHGEARIGWGDAGDLTKLGQPNTYFGSLGSNDMSTLRAFGEEVSEGDILVCIKSETEIGAVGVVNGPYRFEQHPPSDVRTDYKHVLPVSWLYRDLTVSVLPINDNVRFTQKTVYSLGRFTWGDLLAHLQKAGVEQVGATAASRVTHEPHVLVIDEINRGNVSRIFGELITLLEPSKREGRLEALNVQLPYSKRPFSVPDNVYLIGTMNTADRSLTSLDIALRRRFEFREMPPRPDLLDGVMVESVSVGALLRVMNERIELLLDRDHCLGHAYFMPLFENPSLELLARIFKSNILPLLQEYFFEDWQRIQWVLNDHRKPETLRFVGRPTSDLATLFGEGVSLSDQSLRWTVNEAAFNLVDAYAGVISAEGK
jgi:5-methylcytosine-specific restriction protein B